MNNTLTESQLWQAKDRLCRGVPWYISGRSVWFEPLPGRCVVRGSSIPTAAFYQMVSAWMEQINAQPWARQIWEDHNSHTPMKPIIEREEKWSEYW